jgi:hypothetical protein
MTLKEKNPIKEKTFERPIILTLLAIFIVLIILIIDIFNNNAKVKEEYKFLYQKNESIKK